MKVLELGSYLAPAYAGLLLAEQGHEVTKYTTTDPILELNDGRQLWEWVNHGKTLHPTHSKEVAETAHRFDAIIDNHLPATWAKWGINPADVANAANVRWVSLRSEHGGRSFDAIAQAQAWGDKGSLPFYIGDTAAGLFLAFKAVVANTPGHYVIHQATALAKLVEGELVAPTRAWDHPDAWQWCSDAQPAKVTYRGETIQEPARDDVWRISHLNTINGRFQI